MALRSLFIALTLASSPVSVASALADEPLRVVASFSIIGDMVRQIGGEDVSVTTLVGPDGDAHVFEPTPRDAKAVGGAQLLVENGLDFESWMPRLVETAGFNGPILIASEGVQPRELTSDEIALEDAEESHGHDHGTHADGADHGHEETHAGHDHGPTDPHAWQSLTNGEIYARNIAEGLAKADPDHAAEYRARGEAYISQLKALDTEIRRELSALPESGRSVVTSHDAFGYFADAYNLRFIAPEGVSTESEASAQDVARIIDQIRAENIKAVFVESISSTRLIDQITSETDAEVGGALYSDALSGPDGPAPTYIDMFRHNADEIIKALKTS